MSEFYVIVIGEDPEAQLKSQSDRLNSWKESNWLYDGLVLTDNFSMEDLAETVSADERFIPKALLDNGKWISQESMGGNWVKTLKDCLKMTQKGHGVSIYTCHR